MGSMSIHVGFHYIALSSWKRMGNLLVHKVMGSYLNRYLKLFLTL